jgi:hypothetical protein
MESAIYGTPIIYNWRQAEDTTTLGIVYAFDGPILYIGRGLISNKAVTPPLEGTSTAVKATSDERRPEQELRKSREEPRVIHDNHSTCASMDECINENYNPQREVSAKSVTKPKDRLLRDKTNVIHYGSQPKKTKKNNGAGKSKDILATGTSYSSRKRQDDLTAIGWLCSQEAEI